MRHPYSKSLGPAVVAFLVGSGSLSAQESTTRGFTVGLHASGASLAVESEDRSNAAGGGIQIGYGVNRRVTLLLQADGAEFEDQGSPVVDGTWTMGHFDVGLRVNFAHSQRSWVPFLQGGLSYRAVSVQDPVVNGSPASDVTFSGPALTLGGGIDVYLRESFALDVQLLWTGGEFTTLTVDNVSVSGFELDAQSTRFNLGVAWWP